MLKERVISGAVIAVLILIVAFSNEYVLAATVLLIAEIALWELCRAVGIGGKKAWTLYGMMVPLLFTINAFDSDTRALWLGLCIYIAGLFAILFIRHEDFTFEDISKHFAVTLLVSLFFVHIVWTRHTDSGLWNTLVIFIGAWATDTCAYFAGRAFGKHKLAPVISPKKTVEGSIGGMVGVALLMCLFGFVVGKFSSVSPNYIALVVLGLLCGLISQAGDLSASAIKRQYGIKDYGKLMPGHGGIMDRFDSVLFVAPLVYHFVSIFPIFS